MGTRDLVRKVVLEQRVAVWATSEAPRNLLSRRWCRIETIDHAGTSFPGCTAMQSAARPWIGRSRQMAACHCGLSRGSGVTGMTGSRLGQRPEPSSTAAGDQIEDEVIEAPSGTSWALRLLCAR